MKCEKCGQIIQDNDGYKSRDKILCEDCYIDMLLPPVGKMYYEHSASNFMIRLKDSYISCPQQFH
jgi:DNA-directed RNA polymerase subunit RPC12/RpoP